MPRRRQTAATTLADAIDTLLKKQGIDQRVKEYTAVEEWERIVGKRISAVARAVRIQRGILTVEVTSAPWRQELRLRKEEILKKLNGVLGDQVVKDIRFH